MTVKELIEELQKVPQDFEVFFNDDNDSDLIVCDVEVKEQSEQVFLEGG